MSGVTHITIEEKDDGLRLDRWFKEHYPGVSFGKLQKLLRTGQIRIDGKRVKTSARLEEGQTLRIPPVNAAPEGEPSKPTHRYNQKDADFIRSLIIHEDKQLMVLNKPSGLAVQGGSGTPRHIDGMLHSLGKKTASAPALSTGLIGTHPACCWSPKPARPPPNSAPSSAPARPAKSIGP